jgi:hypothetical protein
MAAAQGPDVIKVGAFIGMHGGIDPRRTSSKTTTSDDSSHPTYECEISATELPDGTKLFAPSNLGYQYISSHIDISPMIHGIHKEYVELKEKPPDYIKYCLEKNNGIEKQHVDMVNKYLDHDRRALDKSPETRLAQRPKRFEFGELITLKPRIKWKEHSHYITQKKYETHESDVPPSSIMFFCQEALSEQSLQDATAALSGIRKLRKYTYTCQYDEPSCIYSIVFTEDEYMIAFEFILKIINTVLQAVLQGHRYELSIFDFSCSELFFDDALEDELEGLTPTFLYCDDDGMTYGTIHTDVVSRHIADKEELAYAGEYEGSPIRRMRSEFKPDQPVPSYSPSPAHPPTAVIVIRLDDPIKEFLDLDTRVELQPQSVSPPRSKQKIKEGGRTRIRKKTHRKRITRRRRNGRFRAKGSNRRTRK